MQSQRLIKYKREAMRPLVVGFLLLSLGIMTWFVPPANLIIISFYILLITSIAFIIATYVRSYKKRFIITLFPFAAFWMSYFIGFDLINTILLLSFIIVVATFF